MKNVCLFLWLTCLGCALSAQNPKEEGLRIINKQTVEAHLSFLASDELEGREAGFHGGRIAGEYLVACFKQIGVVPFGESYYQNFEAYNRERQKMQGFQVDADSIAVIAKGIHQKLSMRNVLAKIEGKRKDEYVIIGAHYDHLGVDPKLNGDQIYNGADDNASGVSAVLQIARAFVVSGVQPERTIIFALWDGEEKGLLGSYYFTQNFPAIQQVKGYLNFDMIGRNSDESKPEQVAYIYTEAHPAFGDWLKNDIKKYKLNLKPDYKPWDKPTGGSDNACFAVLDIPVIWYHTDGHPDYHMPGDHTDKINWDKLVNITKVAYLNLWNLANEENY